MTHRLLKVVAGFVCISLLACGLIYLVHALECAASSAYHGDDPLTYLRSQTQNLSLMTASILGAVACEYLAQRLPRKRSSGGRG